MKPILQCIAEAYLERYSDISGFYFLFPNKRSGVFFKNHLKALGVPLKKMPQIKTIGDLVTELSGLSEAGQIEAIFTLYKSYCNLRKIKSEKSDSDDENFESFRIWGETIISDFNIVDQYLVDPDEIFKNVKDFREISSNFLTEEQKEVLKEYFGRDYNDNENSSLWKNFLQEEEISPLKQRYFTLWQILAELHYNFIEELAKKNKSTSGGLYRKAVENLTKEGKDLLKCKKIIIFGFNALNGAERKIFTLLRDFKPCEEYDTFSDFIWDATGPILSRRDNAASRFLFSNKKYFPSPEWVTQYLLESDTDKMPNIRIISSPSNAIQTKIAGEILKEFKEKDPNCPDTSLGLILPDETLLINTLYSIPADFKDLNLTMGYPFRMTGVAGFMNLLRKVYATMRITQQERIFFYRDVKILLSHQYAHIIFSEEELDKLSQFVVRNHKMALSLNELCDYLKNAEILFAFPQKNCAPTLIFKFLQALFENLICEFSKVPENSNSQFEIAHITEYLRNIQEFEKALDDYKISLSPLSILYQIERLIAAVKIGFEGQPLEGLQIMGTLETRGLDFKNLVIMSMNEGVMPRKSKLKTFIPETIRKGFGLPPARYNEDIFAYYFYRLISRAENVALIYDARIGGGLKRGGVSRYILQLQHFANLSKIKNEVWNFNLTTSSRDIKSIPKNPEIRKRLELFFSDKENKKNLSASSLNIYRECQVRFYLRHLLNLNPDPSPSDFLDPITIGNVVHDVMMELYLKKDQQKILLKEPIEINRNKIEKIQESPETISLLIKRFINKNFYHLPPGEYDTLLPEASSIIADQLLILINEILEYDKQLTPFKLYGCEISDHLNVTLPSGKSVNFRFAIDRLDEIMVNGVPRLRIVDYKTGARKREANSIEEVLNGDYRSEQIFQLFVYAWLLNYYDVPGKEDVMTEIYFVPDLMNKVGGLPKIGKTEVTSYKEYSKEFEAGMFTLLEDLFSSDMFKKAENSSVCLNCPFKKICEVKTNNI